jgi:hypothetical protein
MESMDISLSSLACHRQWPTKCGASGRRFSPPWLAIVRFPVESVKALAANGVHVTRDPRRVIVELATLYREGALFLPLPDIGNATAGRSDPGKMQRPISRPPRPPRPPRPRTARGGCRVSTSLCLSNCSLGNSLPAVLGLSMRSLPEPFCTLSAPRRVGKY